MCESTQGSSFQVPWKYITDHFSKTLAKKVNNPKWPLDDLWPHICWFLMCNSTQGSLCPNCHGNTSNYVDTVTFFFKTKSPMGIHPCMWIQWSILQNTTYILHTDIHTVHTYYKVQARQKKPSQKIQRQWWNLRKWNHTVFKKFIFVQVQGSLNMKICTHFYNHCGTSQGSPTDQTYF